MSEMKSTERPLRRKDRQLSPEETRFAAKHAQFAIVSTADASGTPYGIPLSAVYSDEDQTLYCHTVKSTESRLYQNLKQNPKISACMILHAKPAVDEVPQEFTVNFVSVVAAGELHEVTDEDERQRVMAIISKHYLPMVTPEQIKDYYKAFGADTIVWKMTINSMTGKARHKEKFFDRFQQA